MCAEATCKQLAARPGKGAASTSSRRRATSLEKTGVSAVHTR